MVNEPPTAANKEPRTKNSRAAAISLIIHPKSFISPLRASGSSSCQFKFKWGVRLRPTKNEELRTKNFQNPCPLNGGGFYYLDKLKHQ
jgi:hypothetical protein